MDSKVTFRIPAGRNAYVLSFRHPVVKDPNGNGKKIQRGAGTDNEKDARLLAEQLEELLNNEHWHLKAMRDEALGKFNRVAVDAFYDSMPDVIECNKALDKIMVPNDLNIALIGMSGAGKTSLLRRLMGTTKELFPTTSTNRTTTCDIEVIRANVDKYKLAVQFVSRNELEAVLLDNISEAVSYIYNHEDENTSENKILLSKVLNHSEMSVRLVYTFGLYDNVKKGNSDDDEDIEENDVENDPLLPDYQVNVTERNKWLHKIEDSVKQIARKHKNSASLKKDIDYLLQDDDDVLTLIDEIISAILDKFSDLPKGEKIPARAVWPDGWYYEADNREEFIKVAKIFVSDNYKVWGKLLTPIVKAMRLEGPFIEDGQTDVKPMVITDGIGLGHSTNSTSIPSSVLARCEKANAIVFVDPATNPMMANAKDALKSLVEHGFADRLIFAFTKMDQVTGNNYRDINDKKNHVKSTLDNYLKFLGKQDASIISETEIQGILSNCVYFSHMNGQEFSNMTKKGLININEMAKQLANKHISTDSIFFEYDALKLYFYIKEATLKFRDLWAKKTGYSSITSETQHWSRIRALARRLGLLGIDYYCELQPLADFVAIMQEKISIFINQPGCVNPNYADEVVTDALKQMLKRQIGIAFAELNKKRMWTSQKPHDKWISAYNTTGVGSRDNRARIIEGIFDEAAPKLSDIPNLTEAQNKYLADVIGIVEAALSEQGCSLKKFDY